MKVWRSGKNGFFHSFAFAQDLQQRRVFLAALRAHPKVMFDAAEHIVQGQSGALPFDEFAHVLQAFGAIELAVARLADHADDAFDLPGRKPFHRANAVRMSSAEMPSAIRWFFSARRAS